MLTLRSRLAAAIALTSVSLVWADYSVRKVATDLSKIPDTEDGIWKSIPSQNIALMAQMIAKPLPAMVTTDSIQVQVAHDGKYVAFRLTWADKEISEAGKTGEFSDAVALEFPAKDTAVQPPVFMGAPGNPVHLFHWRAQYQRDELKGKKSMKEIYPNMTADIYPNEFADRGKLKPATQEQLEVFSPAVAVGNPQASPKKAVDEILAEGFGTSAVMPGGNAVGRGRWKDGKWTVVISRALATKGGSQISAGKPSAFGIAVWQGGAAEVGSRKSISMLWHPFALEP